MRRESTPDGVPALVFAAVCAAGAVYGVSFLGIKTAGDVLIILAFGLPGLVLGAICGALLARRRWGALSAQLLGIAAGLGYYVLALITSDEEDPCHDCGDILGVYAHPTDFLFLGMSVVEWVLAAVLVASGVRARRKRVAAGSV